MAFEMESSTGSFSYGVSDGFLVYSPRDAPDHQGLICEHDRFQPLERLAACTSVLPKDWRGVIDPIQLQSAVWSKPASEWHGGHWYAHDKVNCTEPGMTLNHCSFENTFWCPSGRAVTVDPEACKGSAAA